MKKILGLVICMVAIFFLWPNYLKLNAQEPAKLEARVSGTIEVGKEIEIFIYAKSMKNLYTGDIQFKFDSSIFQITSIERGNLLSKEGIGNFEQKILPTDENGAKDMARYIFSAVGQNDGYSGEGTIVVFKAKVLKKSDFFINAKYQEELSDEYNMKVELVNSSIDFISYSFTPYGKEVTEEQRTPEKDKDKNNTGTESNPTKDINTGTGSKATGNGSEPNNDPGNKQETGNGGQVVKPGNNGDSGNGSNVDENNSPTEEQPDDNGGKADRDDSKNDNNQSPDDSKDNQEEANDKGESSSEKSEDNIKSEAKENQQVEDNGKEDKGLTRTLLIVVLGIIGVVAVVVVVLVVKHPRGVLQKAKEKDKNI